MRVAPRGANRITHSLAWHPKSGIWTGCSLLRPCQAVLCSCPLANSHGDWAGRPAARAALSSQPQQICLSSLPRAGHRSHRKLCAVWPWGQCRAEPRKLQPRKAKRSKALEAAAGPSLLHRSSLPEATRPVLVFEKLVTSIGCAKLGLDGFSSSLVTPRSVYSQCLHFLGPSSH